MSDVITKLKDALEPEIKEFANTILSDISGDVNEYGADLAKDFANCLVQIYRDGSEEAETNLKHLKLQIKQLAVIHSIKAARETQVLLEKCLITALRIALASITAL